MEMVAVESSNVAAIGYDTNNGLMRVEFKNGVVYSYPNVEPREHTALMGAVSKGAHLARQFRNRATREGRPVKTEATWSRVLQSYDDDTCCGNALNAALLSGMLDEATSWVHDGCGVEWWAETIGTIKHWRPRCPVEVIR